jgi:hypothetical protein
MESILKRIEESYSETESSTYSLDSNSSSDDVDSDIVLEGAPLETSEDRAFIISDIDQLLYISSGYRLGSLMFEDLDQTNIVSCLSHHFGTTLI